MKKGVQKKSEKIGYKYTLAVFLLWIAPPFLLGLYIFVFNNILLSESFLWSLLIPGLVFAVISFAISRIKNPSLRRGSFFALVGATIWSSPALYFLPSSNFYSALPSVGKFMLIIVPTTLLSLIFFVIGRTGEQNLDKMSDLYVMHNRFTK